MGLFPICGKAAQGRTLKIEYSMGPGGAGAYVKNQTYILYMFDSFPECKGDYHLCVMN